MVSLDCREVRLGRKPLQKNAEILCSWLDYKSIIPGSTKVPKSLAQRSGDSKNIDQGSVTTSRQAKCRRSLWGAPRASAVFRQTSPDRPAERVNRAPEPIATQVCGLVLFRIC